jgi:hypothetical protein
MVAGLAVVRQPGPAAQDGQLAAHRGQAHRLPGFDAERDRVPLLIHHQSPNAWCHNLPAHFPCGPMMLRNEINAICS